MTTICTDGLSMAGDGQADVADTIVALSRVKVLRLQDGSIFGFSGRAVDGAALAVFIVDGGKKPKLSKCGAIRLMPDKTILHYNELAEPVAIDAPAAVGSGADMALGAMLAGANPEDAVEVAAIRDPYTGGKITVLHLKDKP